MEEEGVEYPLVEARYEFRRGNELYLTSWVNDLDVEMTLFVYDGAEMTIVGFIE